MTEGNLERLLSRRWPYAEADPAAVLELGRRVAQVGRREGLIHYSDLVSGLVLRMANVDSGAPFELGVPEWQDLDRNILGELLGRLSLDSYTRGGFLATALVTSKETREPSEGFWNLVTELGLLKSSSPTRRLVFWSAQVRLAYDWYADNSW
jgi:hypothetical protein